MCYSRPMTESIPTRWPSIQGDRTCDVCGRSTGNLARHRPACAKRNGDPITATTNLPERDRNEIIWAGAHAAAEITLDWDQQYQDGVTDLDMARLLRGLDQGALIVPSRNINRWRSEGPSPLRSERGYARRALTTVVNEAVRLGLAFIQRDRTGPATWRTYVASAPVHMRSRFNRARPACGGPNTTIKRYRLVDDLTLVDCQACVDLSS